MPRRGLTDMPRKIYKLCVSYDEAGARLRQKVAEGVKGASDFVWQASFRDLESAELPPGDGVVWVYPVFMQTGRTVTETLPELLRSLYAERGLSPALEFRPVGERSVHGTLACGNPWRRNWSRALPCWWWPTA